MSKIGVSLSIDVTKLDKSAFYSGKKGTYVSLTTFIDLDNKDEYDNNGFVTQELGKDRKNEKGRILGNCRVFWSDTEDKKPEKVAQPEPALDFEDDIPF